MDAKTGWLWILSFLGIAAFPPSLLFISEFLIVKSMLAEHKILLSVVFLLLLTIILYGLAKAIIKMSFSELSGEKSNEVFEKLKGLNWTMYFPQLIIILLVFILGIFMPTKIINLIQNSLIGF